MVCFEVCGQGICWTGYVVVGALVKNRANVVHLSMYINSA